MRRRRPPFAIVVHGNNACNSANSTDIDGERAVSLRRAIQRNFVTLVLASCGIVQRVWRMIHGRA
jgi:hypothetical protein